MCPVCGLRSRSAEMERHHPAGRRKAAFLFYVLVHHHCHHQRIHADPGWAEANGLLWKGRNSKTFTYADAVGLVAMWRFPSEYPLQILKQFSEHAHPPLQD